MILKTENLDLFIGRTHILRNISLGIKEGEIVCLLGRNGAGKSSLIKTIIGLYPIKSGKIWFKDRDLSTAPPRERVLAGIGYSPDDARVFTGPFRGRESQPFHLGDRENQGETSLYL